MVLFSQCSVSEQCVPAEKQVLISFYCAKTQNTTSHTNDDGDDRETDSVRYGVHSFGLRSATITFSKHRKASAEVRMQGYSGIAMQAWSYGLSLHANGAPSTELYLTKCTNAARNQLCASDRIDVDSIYVWLDSRRVHVMRL